MYYMRAFDASSYFQLLWQVLRWLEGSFLLSPAYVSVFWGDLVDLWTSLYMYFKSLLQEFQSARYLAQTCQGSTRVTEAAADHGEGDVKLGPCYAVYCGFMPDQPGHQWPCSFLQPGKDVAWPGPSPCQPGSGASTQFYFKVHVVPDLVTSEYSSGMSFWLVRPVADFQSRELRKALILFIKVFCFLVQAYVVVWSVQVAVVEAAPLTSFLAASNVRFYSVSKCSLFQGMACPAGLQPHLEQRNSAPWNSEVCHVGSVIVCM